ncbi:hypothetical protein V6N13_015905 [Hibiscus sabdariffa]|uniref:Uncharacterized protein n=1 Tax=Hibiscus sabdariffa TaxID=183260 RepID=A0ABR2CXU7_9ROSI
MTKPNNKNFVSITKPSSCVRGGDARNDVRLTRSAEEESGLTRSRPWVDPQGQGRSHGVHFSIFDRVWHRQWQYWVWHRVARISSIPFSS